MSQAVLDDAGSGATGAQLAPATDAPPRGSAMGKAIPIPVILSIAAILISLGACAWVMSYDPLGGGISKYDFSTPMKSLVSQLEIELDNDIRAQVELASLHQRQELEEKLKTLKVHREAEWRGTKILFISYEKDGMKDYDTEGFEKDAETGFWASAYVSAYTVKADDEKLAATMREWKERSSHPPTSTTFQDIAAELGAVDKDSN